MKIYDDTYMIPDEEPHFKKKYIMKYLSNIY